MVVGDLAVVKDTAAFLQGQAVERTGTGTDGGQRVDDARAFLEDVIGEVLGIDTRVGSELLLIEALDALQRGIGGETVLAVAVHLQRGEIIELGRLLAAFLLLHILDGEVIAVGRLQALLSLFGSVEACLGTGENGVAVFGRQHPIGPGDEMLYLPIAVDNHRQRGSLHTPDAEHLLVAAILQGVEPRGIHAQQPVTLGTGLASHIQTVVVRLVT